MIEKTVWESKRSRFVRAPVSSLSRTGGSDSAQSFLLSSLSHFIQNSCLNTFKFAFLTDDVFCLNTGAILTSCFQPTVLPCIQLVWFPETFCGKFGFPMVEPFQK